jgi:hypothetical protein
MISYAYIDIIKKATSKDLLKNNMFSREITKNMNNLMYMTQYLTK